MADPPQLHVTGLSYPGFGPVDLQLHGGRCTCLSGPSGAGKSRLLRAISDLDPHSGSVMLAGKDAQSMPPTQWRMQVGLLPAQPAWWHATAGEHFSADTTPALDALGLAPAILEQPVVRLSSGESQRLALLRMLDLDPAVLLLDEPTASVDPDNTLLIEELLRRYMQDHEAAILWVSHDPGQIRRVADRHLILRDGRLEVIAA